MRTKAISKQLSANDSGETGGHQAGILVPKDPEVLSFFPPLDGSQPNPRHHLVFYDTDGKPWTFAFIYYNNRQFGGTRNEYRLTRMTPYFRANRLVTGDFLELRRDEGGRYLVQYRRARQIVRTSSGALKLGSTWTQIDF